MIGEGPLQDKSFNDITHPQRNGPNKLKIDAWQY